MSTNHTQNYALCQWEPSDKVQRVDFNEDNLKIDAALTAQKAAIDDARAVADAAFCPSYLPVVVGSYSGNGTASRTITLGFRPRAVMIWPQDLISYTNSGYLIFRGGMALDGQSIMARCPISITEDGFQVYYDTSGTSRRETNFSGMRFFYVVVR